MRKRLMLLFILGMTAFPFLARAQSEIKLAYMQVQLWPEYDQPSMLVIYDFQVADSTALPGSVNIRIPKDARLWTVAQMASNGLVNTEYDGPSAAGDWQVVSVKISELTAYRVEFYQPISRNGAARQFDYLWPADYAVDNLSVSLRLPVDTTSITTDPLMDATQSPDGAKYLQKDFGALAAGRPFPLKINYTKTTDNLSVAQQLQPSQPLSSDTPGRVMLSNYLPYILGGIGAVLIAGGFVYFWRSNRGGSQKRGRRAAQSQETDSDVYCHRCGTRAHAGDRFCRVCGTRLRMGE